MYASWCQRRNKVCCWCHVHHVFLASSNTKVWFVFGKGNCQQTGADPRLLMSAQILLGWTGFSLTHGDSNYPPSSMSAQVDWLHSEFLYIYTTVQKFGVIQTISCLPWKLTLLFIKWILHFIENVVKTLTRLEIMNNIWSVNFVLQTSSSKEGQLYRLYHQHNCLHKGFLIRY